MNRILIISLAAIAVSTGYCVRADVVTDWNDTIHDVIQAVPPKANPGLSTRSIALMNGAIYDVFQAFDRTHQPLIVHHATPAAGANLNAAVARAARDILADCYDEAAAAAIWGPDYSNRLSAIADTQANKDAGEALGALIAQKYISKRSHDHSGDMGQYNGPGGIGHWQSDPLHPGQQAWGPGWGTVHTWVVPSSDYFDVDAPSGRYEVPGPPTLTSDAYRDAFNMVKDYGEVDSVVRSADQTKIGLFWAYDRPGFGPPPVLFVRNLIDIAGQTQNTPADNARLFALTSVAMADAAVASWDVKFKDDFWRPITGIWEGDNDGNSQTDGTTDWYPLGAPGGDPSDPNSPVPGIEDDFTPPFPAYTSGHATMGGAVFKAIEEFFQTNNFADIAGHNGLGPDDNMFRLFSDEAGAGGFRDYSTFTHPGLLDPLILAEGPYSPDSENALSRIFLGIHWIFDQQDGMDLGHAIATYVAENRFGAVPEPCSLAMGLFGVGLFALVARRRRA